MPPCSHLLSHVVPRAQELFELRKKVKTRQQVCCLAPRRNPAREAPLPTLVTPLAWPPATLSHWLWVHWCMSRRRLQVKPHLFTHTKHRIGQLQTLLSQRAA